MRRDPFAAKEVFVPAGSVLPEDFEAVGIERTHVFCNEGVVTLFNMPPGTVIGQHQHTVNHDSALLMGRVILTAPRLRIELNAPWTGTLLAYTDHKVEAVEAAVWACIWTKQPVIVK